MNLIRRHGTLLVKLAALAVCSLFALQVAFILASHPRYFWDFDVYYVAASALADGINPYAAEHPDHPFRYVYPLPSLVFYTPFTLLSATAAPLAHFGFQLLVLGLLWRHWARDYVPRDQWPLFLAFFLLAFSSSVSSGLRAGNVAILEATLVWAALACYQRDRVKTFAALIVLSAMFKIVTIVFLGLLVLRRGYGKFGVLAATTAAYAGINAACYWAFPSWYTQLVANIRLLGDASRGALNPSLRELTADLSQLWSISHLYVPAVVLVALITAWRLFGMSDRRHQVMLFTLGVCLVMPRLKDYSYVVLILPVFWTLMQMHSRPLQWIVLGAAVTPTRYFTRYLFGIPDPDTAHSLPLVLWEYTPLWVLAAAWLYQVSAAVAADDVRETAPSELASLGNNHP